MPAMPIKGSMEAVAGNLLKYSANGQPLDEDIVAARHYVEVTPADVQAAFKQWLKPANMVEVVKGPAPQ